MKEKICQFKEVRIAIPQRLIIKCFYKREYLTSEESLKMRGKLGQVKDGLNKLQHIKSLIDIALLKMRG